MDWPERYAGMVQAWAPPPFAFLSARLEKTSIWDLNGSKAESVGPSLKSAPSPVDFQASIQTPFGKYTNTMRRGNEPAAASAALRLARGAKVSRKGSAMDTPMPLRAVRREMGRWIMF